MATFKLIRRRARSSNSRLPTARSRSGKPSPQLSFKNGTLRGSTLRGYRSCRASNPSNPLVSTQSRQRSHSRGRSPVQKHSLSPQRIVRQSRLRCTSAKRPASTEELLRTNQQRATDQYTVTTEERRQVLQDIKKSFQRHTPLNSSNFYKIGQKLGKGAFGKVYLGVHKLTGSKVAIKTINKETIEDEHARRKVFQEVFVMNRVQHPNVVKILEVFESARHLMIVLEYVEGTDLLQLLRTQGKLTESEAKPVFWQVIKAVQACHFKNVAHRDVKLDNILLSFECKQAKLCDFGVSRMVKPSEKVQEQCGTPAYLAPEIIVDRGYEPLYVDLWSMGVLLFAIVTGTVPFKAETLPELHKRILQCKYTFPEFLSGPVKELISRMLNPVPHLRISLEAMLNHPWLREVNIELELKQGYYANHLEILKQMGEMGFSEEYVSQSLRFKDLNHSTATYHLLGLHK